VNIPFCNTAATGMEAVRHPTKNVLSNISNLLANPDLQLFSIVQSMEYIFFSWNICIGRSLELSNPVTVEATKHPQIWIQGVLGILCSSALHVGVSEKNKNYNKNFATFRRKILHFSWRWSLCHIRHERILCSTRLSYFITDKKI
jgi:hypothetical protein